MRLLFTFRNISPVGRLFLLIFLILVCSLFSLTLGYLISVLIWGSDVVLSASSGMVFHLKFHSFFQIINQIGIFVIPPVLFALITEEKPNRFLGNIRPPAIHLAYAVLLIIVAAPLISRLSIWNEAMRLPQFLAGFERWMRNAEESAKLLTEQFLEVKSISGLSVNLLMMAILPAIGEELLFRSGLIGIFRKMFRKVHWPVIISAFIFSAFHLQFFSFLPRFVLGIALGYLFVWSGSVWIPVVAHFINNSVIVVGSWLVQNEYLAENFEDIPGLDSMPAVVLSVVLVVLILFRVKSTRTGRAKEEI